MRAFRLKKRVASLLGGGKAAEGTPLSLAFVHIPKCAGTSLIAALKTGLGPVPCRSMDHGRTHRAVRSLRKQWETDDWMRTWIGHRQALFHTWLAEGIPFVYGHMPVSARTMEDHGATHHFFTVLRDPVGRFISNYVYDKTGPGIRIPDTLPAGESSVRAELERFLETPEARWMALEQVLMLAGLNSDGGFEPEEATRRATENLGRMSLVGFTHDMDGFAGRFGEVFGVTITVEAHNTTADWIQKSPEKKDYHAAFEGETLRRVEELCRWEQQLYDHALAAWAGPSGAPAK